MNDELRADDPVGCGCDEYPECTHALYFYMGVKHAETLNRAAPAGRTCEATQIREGIDEWCVLPEGHKGEHDFSEWPIVHPAAAPEAGE
jgi:hypothetical protein